MIHSEFHQMYATRATCWILIKVSMQITIVDDESGNLTSCQVDASTLVADLKAILEAETGAPIDMQQIYVQGRLLGDG